MSNDQTFNSVRERINRVIKAIVLDKDNEKPLAIQLLTQSRGMLDSIEKTVSNYESLYQEELNNLVK